MNASLSRRAPAPLMEFLGGIRAEMPILLGVIPFGMIVGLLAMEAGLTPAAAQAMSFIVFAGSAQFISTQLFATGAPGLVIVFTIAIVNLRHALYSASLLPHVRHLPQRWRVPLAFWLTDESFAVVHRHYLLDKGALEHKHWYFLGSCLAMYSVWFVCTLVGVLLGQALPGLADWGLDFAMVATFIGIVVPLLRNRPMIIAALVAGGTAVLAHGLPYQLGLMLAALLGVVAGVLAEHAAGRERLTVPEVE